MAESSTVLPWGTARKPRRDDEFVVAIDAIDERGQGLGRVEDYRVSVRGAVPGSHVRVQVVRRRGQRVDARLRGVLDPGPHSVAPPCAHYGTCGGCSLQGLDYGAQLVEGAALVRRQLAPIDPSGEIAIDPVLGADVPWRYRNKMDFTFSNRRWVELGEPDDSARDFALGLHVRGRHEKVLDIASCDLQFAGGDALLAGARELALELGLTAWDNKSHTGVLRHLVLRHAPRSGEILVLLVTSPAEPEAVERYVREFVRRHPEITTLVHAVRSAVASVAVGESERIAHGPGVIHDSLGRLSFRVSAGSFFQTNTAQAEVLVETVRSEAGLQAQDVLYDVYCGGGALTLSLAEEAREAWGFEWIESAVEDARYNARANGIENVHFKAGDVAQTLGADALAGLGAPPPDVVVVDPPRAGIHPRALGALRALAPRRLIYVSCHLPAAVRDLAHLVPHDYRLVRVRPIDMFPQTAHLECVLTLERTPVGGPDGSVERDEART